MGRRRLRHPISCEAMAILRHLPLWSRRNKRREIAMLRCVALDDYQNVAAKFGEWNRLKGQVELHSLTEFIYDRDALVAALADADIIIAMRERSAFDRALFERLPKL
jgi:hypothetical protein